VIKRPIPFILPQGERTWLTLNIPDDSIEKAILNNETILLLTFNSVMEQYLKGTN